jgi:XTP/dITP diphosphohydrolase
MGKLLIATGNLGKVKEIRALLVGMNIELLTPSQIGLSLDILEDGETYQANAALKAHAFAKAAGMPVLADDSGLEVDALGGMPGIHSARYSSIPGSTDATRREFLLDNLHDKSQPWLARFRCVIALAETSGVIHFTEGVCPGEIIPQERGHNGFGYDPIFLIPHLGKTMAELSMDEKNHISHRALAVIAARPILLEIFNR